MTGVTVVAEHRGPMAVMQVQVGTGGWVFPRDPVMLRNIRVGA
jgi:hypothetical protein